MSSRNRSEGWSHAKRTGHSLEEELVEELRSRSDFAVALHRMIYGAPGHLASIVGGGSSATHCRCVLGGKTPAKADMVLRWNSGVVTRISLKKSEGGQAWLISTDRFVQGFGAQIGTLVPEVVQNMLRLFIGPIDIGTEVPRTVMGGSRQQHVISELEIRHQRLVASTLGYYYRRDWEATMLWLRNNAAEIASLCFARGLCADEIDQANYLWYNTKNEVGEGEESVYQLYEVADIEAALRRMPASRRVVVGPRNGGSTLIFPFGFLQMHRPTGKNQMQFHHRLNSIRQLIGSH